MNVYYVSFLLSVSIAVWGSDNPSTPLTPDAKNKYRTAAYYSLGIVIPHVQPQFVPTPPSAPTPPIASTARKLSTVLEEIPLGPEEDQLNNNLIVNQNAPSDQDGTKNSCCCIIQ